MTEIDTEAGAAPRRRLDRALAALLAVAALWYGWFIFRTSFVIDGERVFCLFDDAMVSMTYARNLLEGYGLNWGREGAPVEGFTHPLWTALMVLANALPIPLRFRSLPMQVLSAGLLLGNVVLVRWLVQRHFTRGQARTWLPATVLTAFCYPLVYWSLMGMETALQAAILTASVLLALDAVAAVGRGRHVEIWLLTAAAYLLRMDMLVPMAAVQVFVLTQGGLRRQERGRWLLGLGLFAAAVLGYGLFRWLYFGDVLPNTYYLKLTGVPLTVRLLRGLEALGDFARAHAVLLLPIGLGVALLISRGGERRDHRDERRRYALPAGVFLLQCAYSVWVGGDAWEMDINVRANRFIAFALPMVFVLGNGLLNTVLEALRAWSAPGALRAWWAPESPGAHGAPGADRVPHTGETAGEPAGAAEQPAEPPAAGPAEPRGLLPSYLAAVVTMAALLFANGVWGSERNQENLRNLLVTGRPLHVVSHQIVYTQLKALQKIAKPGAVVAAFWAGIPAYFSDFHNVDLLGYNDRRIAHSRARVQLNEDNFRIFQPGHMKWDTDYVLAERRPDAFLQVWGIDRPGRVLRRLGYVKVDGFWVRKKSPMIRRPSPEIASPAPPAAPPLRPALPPSKARKPPPPISSI